MCAVFIFAPWRIPVLRRVVVLIILGALMAACATPVGRENLLGFIQDGHTTRDETLFRLGDPTGLYEGGRIISYRLDEDRGGYFVVDEISADFGSFTTNLIMVFDERDVLKRHSLVQVND